MLVNILPISRNIGSAIAPLAPPVSAPLSKIRAYAHPQYIIALVSGTEAKQFLVKLFYEMGL